MRGDLKEVLRDLLALGREQKRCGLDKPDEETQARIRDLVQAGEWEGEGEGKKEGGYVWEVEGERKGCVCVCVGVGVCWRGRWRVCVCVCSATHR